MRGKFAVVGCVTYAFPAGRVVGQTAFVFEVAKDCGDEKLVLPCDLDVAEPGSHREAELAIREADFAGFAR